MKKYLKYILIISLITIFIIVFTIKLSPNTTQEITGLKEELITPVIIEKEISIPIIIVTEEIVQNEIRKQAKKYNIDISTALRIANCESNFNPYAKNSNSSAKGIYQFISSTWEKYCTGNVYDYKENIKMFCILFPTYPSWWSECL